VGSTQAPEAEVAPAPPAPPKVVTSSRRRVARRPAGPPASAATALDTVTEPRDSSEGPGTDGADGAAVPVAAHVPVKKKGSRKR
jgi:ribonuclease E